MTMLVRFTLGFMLVFTALFLIALVLIQRGRGGGLAGAFGGAGGQSAFGTKAGDLFTRITVVVAAIWILLCILAINVLGTSRTRLAPTLGGAAATAPAQGAADTDMEPAEPETKPADGEKKPGDGEKKPGDGEKKPGDGEKKPAEAAATKPAAAEAKPAEPPTKPAEPDAKQAVPETKPAEAEAKPAEPASQPAEPAAPAAK